MTTNRELLIALNASPLPRGAVCRLGADLARWAEPGAPPGAARALAIPREVLDRARALVAQAPALARQEEDAARALGGRIVTQLDPDFPPPLLHLDHPPPALYVLGTLPAADRPAAAVVGSRRADPYGREVAEWLGRSLARAGAVVISGFAWGVDAAAHRGALDAPGVPAPTTVAVLGAGLGVDYPHGQGKLAREIALRGALLSEFPCGRVPQRWHFPVRNRLIAALSRAVVVVRATPRSGSLVTARLALDLGREVFAVPGRLFEEASAGVNSLLADGARPALDPAEVAAAAGVLGLPAASSSAEGSPPADPVMAQLLAAMPPAGVISPEDLTLACGLGMDQILGLLLELELAGTVRRYPGSGYARVPGGLQWASGGCYGARPSTPPGVPQSGLE